MHPVRRRKKRPNYGVRTVEVSRGKNGFGFTISGQQPCILSCIVAGSPAESAGLRAGDYLVAVEGQSVSKVPHDDVVRLIASSSGVLKLQIAENYYSDSSDDDAIVTARQKPKYPHKLRSNVQNSRSNGVTQQSRAAKVVRDLRSGVMFEEQVILEPAAQVTAVRNNKTISDSPQWKAPNHLPPPLPRLYFPGPSRANSQPAEAEEQLLQAVVGYLGTIEMPRKIPPGSRLQIVRGCIKRLRADKRTHTVVLMTVLRQSLRLTNSAGQVLAIYPADRVTFCGSSSDEDRKHFGIVTTSTGEDPSNSCHVFAIDSRTHAEHMQKMQVFKIECNIDPVTGHCQEFPQNSDSIIAAVRNFYETGVGANRGNDIDEPVMANSPQPSNDSTTTTSNSDSGIGFRDDCGNQSDRILVVDVQNQCLHIQQIRGGEERQETISDCERLAVRAMPVPCEPQHVPSSSAAVVAASNRSRSPLSTSSEGGREPREDMSVSSSGAAKSPIAGTGRHSADDMSVDSARSQDAVYNKLSPKVFGVPQPPTSQSLEDLKVSEQTADSVSASHLSRNQQHWGSLQELRSFVSDCFDTSTATQELHEDTDEGVSCWAASFEKLLEDSNGLHAFAEFLKKEFSHENIYFWVACERYRSVDELDERRRLAQDIFDKHLCLGALEPVNVDSHARQVTQEELGSAHPSLFLQAQKQIFNLMKFDSYPRFIKSDLYKECLLKEISGEKLPFEGKMDSALELNGTGNHINNRVSCSSSSNGGSSTNSSNHSPHQLPHSTTKLKKSRSDAEERLRRKSLLPWSRKSRCKSRDRVTEDAESSISSSRSSLASWDLTLNGSLCRVVLPDGATAVVQIRPPQTIRQLIQRLLEKRALLYSHFQVFYCHSNKALSLDEDATVLGGQEVRVEDRIVFMLDLPNRKTVAVKSKHNKTLAHVLRPILSRYGYRLEMVTLCLMSENEVVEPSVSVVDVDNQRLQVLTRSTPTECMAHMQGWHVGDCSATHNKVKCAATLDEITNRVFEDLLQGKTENLRHTASDQGSVRSDDWGSEHSSGIFTRLLSRDSAFLDKGRDRIHKNKKANKQTGPGDENRSVNVANGGSERKPSKLPPLIAKWKPGTKIEGRSESDVLYEDLKRAQRSRLEDQRGTEINFELPDFLKAKEYAPQSVKKIRKFRRDVNEPTGNSKFYQDTLQSSGDDKSSLPLHTERPASTGIMSRILDQSFSNDGVIPTPEQAEEYFLRHSRMPPPKSNNFISGSSNNNNSSSTINNCNSNVDSSNRNNNLDSTTNTTLARPQRLSNEPPPPLPPKPKLPPPSSLSWPLCNSEDPKLKNSRVRRAVYLDQPSSSFV